MYHSYTYAYPNTYTAYPYPYSYTNSYSHTNTDAYTLLTTKHAVDTIICRASDFSYRPAHTNHLRMVDV